MLNAEQTAKLQELNDAVAQALPLIHMPVMDDAAKIKFSLISLHVLTPVQTWFNNRGIVLMFNKEAGRYEVQDVPQEDINLLLELNKTVSDIDYSLQYKAIQAEMKAAKLQKELIERGYILAFKNGGFYIGAYGKDSLETI